METCQYCRFPETAYEAVRDRLICKNKEGSKGLWQIVDYGGRCGNFRRKASSLRSGGDDVAHIPLTQGKVALIDAEDYASLIRYKWHVGKNKRVFYASTCVKSRTLFMHRVIMRPPKGMVVDHINHDGLDNRRSNLRICTNAQNVRNSRPCIGKTVKYKGVSFHKINRSFRANIKFQGKTVTIGCYEDEVAAAKAYDEKAKELYGEYAYLNFPVQ